MDYTTGYLNSLTKFLPNEIRNLLQQTNWVEFQDRIDKRLSMYYEDWKEELASHIKNKLSKESQAYFFPPSGEELWPLPININLMQRVTNEISLLYKSQAHRAFVIEAEEINQEIIDNSTQIETEKEKKQEMDERFSEIADVEYNAMLQTVNKLVNICNIVVVMVTPDIHEEKGIRFDILTPDLFMPIQDPDNPQRLIGIMYSIDSADTPGGFVNIRKEIIYFAGNEKYEAFYAESESGWNFDNNKIEKKPYPYYYEGKPFLPFVTFRADFPIAGEYVNRTQGDGLYNATLQVADLISRFMRSIYDQSIKQLAITGAGAKDIPPILIRDNLAIIKFPYSKDQAEMQLLDFQINISEIWKSILDFIEVSIATYGLSIDKFKSTPQSGLSIRLSNQQLINKIEDQRPFFYTGEKKLADIIRKINNIALSAGEYGAIADNAEFIMDFGPLPFDPDPYEMSEKYLALVEANIMSAPELIQKYDPELTFEEACDKYERNKIINKKYKISIGLNDLAGGKAEIPPAVDDNTIIKEETNNGKIREEKRNEV